VGTTCSSTKAAARPFNGSPFYLKQQDVPSFKQLQSERLAKIQNLVDQIAAVKGQRTIENTLELYDEAFILVDSVANESSLLSAVHPDAAMREAASEMLKKSTHFITELNVNVAIYNALNALDLTKADRETSYYVKTLLDQMRGRGALASPKDQERIKELELELVAIDQEFEENIANGSHTIAVNSLSELEGLPQAFIEKHRSDPDGKFILNADSDYGDVMRYAKSDELRRRMYIENLNRAYPANLDVLQRMLAKRHELANLYGFPNWADYKSSFSLMKTPQAISQFLDELAQTAKCVAGQRKQVLLRQKHLQDPSGTDINPWEADYWSTRLESAQKSEIDWAKVSEYFPFQATKLGIFHVFERMFGIRFQHLKNAPVWHPTVECWEVYEDRRLLGRVYLDLYKRPEKSDDPVQYPVRTGVAGRQLAESVLATGFLNQTKGEAQFLSYSEAETFFHELGHSLHHVFSGNHRWIGIGGARTESDFVEVPSYLFEEWMHDVQTLQTFAKHYKTGEPIPEKLVHEIQRSRDADRAEQVLDYVFYSVLSLKLYDADPTRLDTTELVKRLTDQYGPYPYVDGTHIQCSFQYFGTHTSEFYVFLLSQVMAKDFLTQFNRSDLLARGPASRYRDLVLAPGGSAPASDLIQKFLGRPFSSKPWQEWLKSTAVVNSQ
jgi:thimet oligopeptidase